jgi:hypothetical protein
MTGQMSVLLDPYLKHGRAAMHLRSVDEQLKAFRSGTPYSIERYDDLRNGRHVVKTKLAEVPDEIPLTVGDALYCLRCSLDQLVWGIAKRYGGLVNPSHTQFPILGVDDSRSRSTFERQTDGVPEVAKDLIRSVQPYHTYPNYKSHPLWRLNFLCNTDKHRRIPANGSELTIYFPAAVREITTVEVFEDYGTTSVPLSMKEKLQLQPQVNFKVNFGWGDPTVHPDSVSVSSEDLWEIHSFVERVVFKKFIRLYP